MYSPHFPFRREVLFKETLIKAFPAVLQSKTARKS